MFKKKDDIRTFLVIVIVCVLCVVFVLILNRKSNFDKLDVVNEYNVFFTNVNYVNNYLNYIASDNNEAVYSLLDNKYIENNNITVDNVLDNIDDYSFGVSLKANNMDFVQVGNNFVYYINGKIYENTYNGKELVDDNFSMIVINDYDNLSYSLYPVDKNYKSVINNVKKININNNNYNNVSGSELINKEQICVMYLSDFIDSMVINESYDLLSDSMKDIYTNKDDYQRYINNNIRLFNSTAAKCKLEKIDDKRVYTVIDDNENTYVFTEDNIMNYKVDFYLKKISD